MTTDLFILFTMDVEPIASQAGISGPASMESGLRVVQDYCEVLETYGYPATFFVHPEVVSARPDFFNGLCKKGSAVGLHLHTTKFAAEPQQVELGGLTSDKQRQILALAADMFEDGMGFRPRLFRPGCFSANDSTCKVLSELGFIGGGISIPGRIWPERFCVWAGSYPYAHFANESFRQCPGDLPFVDIPLSVDMTRPISLHPVGFYHYPDLRPGGVYTEEDEVSYDRRQLLQNILQKMAADDPPVKTLVIDVHNDRNLKSKDSQAAKHLQSVLEGIETECEALGWTPVPGTYDEVVQHVFALEEF